MGTLTIARVLAKVLPRVITTSKERGRLLNEVEKLMGNGAARTAEGDSTLDLMVRVIGD